MKVPSRSELNFPSYPPYIHHKASQKQGFAKSSIFIISRILFKNVLGSSVFAFPPHPTVRFVSSLKLNNKTQVLVQLNKKKTGLGPSYLQNCNLVSRLSGDRRVESKLKRGDVVWHRLQPPSWFAFQFGRRACSKTCLVSDVHDDLTLRLALPALTVCFSPERQPSKLMFPRQN